jgi:ubiquitin thioesterase OTU1
MKLKLQLPKKTQVVDLDSGATLGALFEQVDGKVSKIKFGFPPKAATIDDPSVTLESLGIKHGEQLNIELQDAVYEGGGDSVAAPSEKKESSSVNDPNAPPTVPCGGGHLKLRVMEDDNSCMFASIG